MWESLSRHEVRRNEPKEAVLGAKTTIKEHNRVQPPHNLHKHVYATLYTASWLLTTCQVADRSSRASSKAPKKGKISASPRVQHRNKDTSQPSKTYLTARRTMHTSICLIETMSRNPHMTTQRRHPPSNNAALRPATKNHPTRPTKRAHLRRHPSQHPQVQYLPAPD